MKVRQTDVAGNTSSVGTLTFTLDTTAATPGVALSSDTGTSSGDGITSSGVLESDGNRVGRDGAVLDRWRDDVDKAASVRPKGRTR